MRVLRVLLVAATLIAVVASPVLFRSAASSTRLATGYDVASSDLDPVGRVYAQGNGNGNNNNNNSNDGNDNSNNNNSGGGGNDNGGGKGNGNGNGGGNGNGNGNDNFVGASPSRAQRDAVRKCFDVEEVGVLQLIMTSGDITIVVPPNVGFPSITDVTLRRVDPATVPAVPGTLVDSMVWAIDGQNGCGGPALGVLGNDYNLGITYNVPADKSRVRIMRLVNNQWTEVNTVPDPNPTNPYVSTTTRDVGVFALVQR